MKFVLVRHGQSTDNVTRTLSGQGPAPLTDLGRKQAMSLGQKLLEMGAKFDAVYSSDLRRAYETTTIICYELGIEEITFDVRLREGDAGIFTGQRVDDLTVDEKALFDSLIVDLDSKVFGGESVNEQMKRTRDAFVEIVENHNDESVILLVGHGGTLYHILKNTLNILPDTDEWFGNCKMNIIEQNTPQGDWKLTMLDSIQLGE